MRDDLLGSGPPMSNPRPVGAVGDADATISLRILATTDIHMQLLGHDYTHDRGIEHQGMAGLATLICQARDEAAAAGAGCLLVDNGDFLQGTALGSHLAKMQITPDHPAVACFAALGYDAVGIGNHDLDYGMNYLLDIADALPMPMVSTNLRLHQPGPIERSAVVPCVIPHPAGAPGTTLQVGILSVLPERTALWNAQHLVGTARVDPALQRIEEEAADLRAQGADLILLLAHQGVEGPQATDVPIEDARNLAILPCVDALITGHTHRRLPGEDHRGYWLVDIVKGALGPCPAVMAGYAASDLAVLDLKLQPAPDRRAFRVHDHETNLRRNHAHIAPDPKILSICTPAHQASRAELARPCGQVERTLQNYFSLAVPTQTCALVANAKHLIIRNSLEGRPEQDLPILAAASSHTAGGRGGPGHFLHIDKGNVYRRHLAGLSPFLDAICALRVTGAELRAWLEHKAGVFQHLQPERPSQLLVRPDRPAFEFDTIFGLTYQIDPSRPTGTRIFDLCHQGSAVNDIDDFVLATTSFRISGGGGGAQFPDNRVILRGTQTLPEALAETVQDGYRAFDLATKPWCFAPDLNRKAILQTSHKAVHYLNDISHLSPEPIGTDADGFLDLRVSL